MVYHYERLKFTATIQTVPLNSKHSDYKTSSPYLNGNSLSKYSSVPSLLDLNQTPAFFNTVYKESYKNNGYHRQNFASSLMHRPKTSYCY